MHGMLMDDTVTPVVIYSCLAGVKLKCNLLKTIQSTWQREIQHSAAKQSSVVTIKVILLKAKKEEKSQEAT